MFTGQDCQMDSLSITAKVDNLDRVTGFVLDHLKGTECSSKVQLQIRLAVEEVFVNVSSYAYGTGEGSVEIGCDLRRDPLRLCVQFTDSGEPFDPLARDDPDTSEEALMGRVGGLGIFLVKTTMDNVRYERRGDKNVLTMEKNI